MYHVTSPAALSAGAAGPAAGAGTHREKRAAVVGPSLLACLALLAASVGAGALAAAAGRARLPAADAVGDEGRFVELINRERTSRGKPALLADPQLVSVARTHTSRMAAEGAIFHNQNLAKEVAGAWLLIGENVGMGGGVESLHAAFMNSPSHRANILDNFNRIGIGIVMSGRTMFVTELFSRTASVEDLIALAAPPTVPEGTQGSPDAVTGYRLVASDGGIFAFGNAAFLGSTAGKSLARPVAGIAPTPSRKGYWVAGSDGAVFAFGDAPHHGNAPGAAAPIVGIAGSASGGGYWLARADGAVFAFGDAPHHGSARGVVHPVVAMAATPGGGGYWLAASDGGIFAFGDAGFLGSTGGIRLNRPIVAMAATPGGGGYWLAASDGGIFAFGDAAFVGSTGGAGLARPIVGMAG